MIQVHKDALGNITGYFDTNLNQWVAPPDAIDPLEQTELEVIPASDEDDSQEPADYANWTKDQLKEALEGNGIPYAKHATKDQLVALMQAEAT